METKGAPKTVWSTVAASDGLRPSMSSPNTCGTTAEPASKAGLAGRWSARAETGGHLGGIQAVSVDAEARLGFALALRRDEQQQPPVELGLALRQPVLTPCLLVSVGVGCGAGFVPGGLGTGVERWHRAGARQRAQQ